MLPIAGRPLLRWLIDAFKKERIDEITVVGGYRADAIDTAGIKLVVNERYETTGELVSFACAIDHLDTDTIVSYGDLLFRSYVLRDLLESEADFAVVVDSSPTDAYNQTVRDFAYCSRADDRGLFGDKVLLSRIDTAASADAQAAGQAAAQPQGRWIGLLRVSRRGLVKLKEVLADSRTRADFHSLDLPDLLNALIERQQSVEVVYVHGHWRGVNDLEDLRRAVDFAHGQIAPLDPHSATSPSRAA
jgi:phosphoenolpyruvate phosphomutase